MPQYTARIEKCTVHEMEVEIYAADVKDADDRFSEIIRCLDELERTPDPDLYTPEEMVSLINVCNAEWELSHDTFEIIEWSEGEM